MLGPHKEHYLIVEDNGSEICRKTFLSFNNYMDNEFYKNLDLDINDKDGTVQKTEVDCQKFFVEWWRNIAQQNTFVNIAEGMQHDICLSSNEQIIESLMSFKYTMVGQFFTILEDISKLINKNNKKSLENKYKFYIEVKYDVEDIEGYYSFLRELKKYKEKKGLI